MCLSQHPGILSVIWMYMNKCNQLTQRVIPLRIFFFFFLRVYVRLLIRISFSPFVSECVYQSPAILTLSVDVSLRL